MTPRAAAALVTLITTYIAGATTKLKSALGMGVALAAAYTALYVILLSEDYALLLGSLLIFTILAALIGSNAGPMIMPFGSLATMLVLAFARPLPARDTTLEIAYDAPFSTSLDGLYRVDEASRWYAFTQFESTDARRATRG